MASELRVNTIYDKNGDNSSSAEEIKVGRAKAWVHFDGSFATSPFTEANGGIRASFNVSSITNNASGRYTVNFEISMPDANYCSLVTGTCGNTSWGYACHDTQAFGGSGTNLGTTSGFNIRSVDGGNLNYIDHPWICAAVFR